MKRKLEVSMVGFLKQKKENRSPKTAKQSKQRETQEGRLGVSAC